MKIQMTKDDFESVYKNHVWRTDPGHTKSCRWHIDWVLEMYWNWNHRTPEFCRDVAYKNWLRMVYGI